MKILNVDSKIIKELRRSGISKEMRSLESSDWIVYETIDNQILGAAGIGGIFHTSSINIHEKFREKGYGESIDRQKMD